MAGDARPAGAKPADAIKGSLASLDASLRHVRTELGADITVQRLLILINVYLNEGLSQNELLTRLDSTSTTALSRNLADLSVWTSRKTPGPGLIELRPDPFNLRRKQVFLSDKGRAFFDNWVGGLADATNRSTGS